MKLAIVTATTDPKRAEGCIQSWFDMATEQPEVVVVLNGPHGRHAQNGPLPGYDKCYVRFESGQYLGSVPAFRTGVEWALANLQADVIACFHDDLEIHEGGWDRVVLRHFQKHPECGLAGFGAAIGIGASDIYQTPYDPMQLARIGFRSNLVDAEQHGMRSLLVERAACFDGFSLLGRRAFFEGYYYDKVDGSGFDAPDERLRPWNLLDHIGCVHHCYDTAMGAIAARYGWESWFLPVRCRHFGGRTAVGDAGYQEWAKAQTDGVGDRAFWERAHRACYDEFRDVLPLRV